MVLRGILRQAFTPIRSLLGSAAGERAQGTEEVDVTTRTVSRAEVAFKAQQDSEGCLLIGLVLTKDGKPAAGERLFTLDLVPELTPREIQALVDVLNQCITHLGMATLDPEQSEGGHE
jgi:hypothetical protein